MTARSAGRRPRRSRSSPATGPPSAIAVVGLVALLLGTVDVAAGQERRPRLPGAPDEEPAEPDLEQLDRLESLPDSLLTASLRAVRDSLQVHRDSVAAATLDARRDELSGGDFPERDALFRGLGTTSGYEVIEYRADTVRLEVPRRTIDLEGRAQLNRADDVLVADTIRHLGDRQFIEARGAIELLGADGSRAVSDSTLYYDIERLRGTLFDAESDFYDGGTEWRVFGNVIPVAQDTVYATRAAFTSCELEEPHYTFRAGELKMVTRDVLVAWPVVLYVSRVPVLWLPFFAADIRQGRRSGIIPPRFGVNDIVQSSGQTSRNISDFGYYWAINDYLDAQATVDWFSGNYTRVNGDVRYRFLKQFVRGNLGYSQSFSDAGDNLRLRANHDQELGLNTTLRAAVDYVQDTRIHQDQSVNPEEQIRTFDSDVSLSHRFPFGNVQAGAERRQEIDGDRTTTTLPRVNLSLLPVTLFGAPAARAGPFNNLTINGSTRFSRTAVRADSADDRVTTRGAASSSFRVGQLSLSGNLDVDDVETTPQDDMLQDLPAESRTTLDWNTSANFQIGLVGSTTFRPTATLSGLRFRSDDTDGEFVSGPGRASLGATLTTDVYGFYPGFGPFSRLRHKFSPSLSHAWSPAVDVDEEVAEIPGFPSASGVARNQLTVGLNQTFEAKVTPADAEDGVAADTAPGDAAAADGPGEPDRDPAEPYRPPRDRIVTLLGINTSALVFDFENAQEGEPVLVSETIRNSLTSDLLRGLRIDVTHDLFEGSGEDRSFAPFLTRLSASFSLSSGQGFGDIIGLGGGDGRAGAPGSLPAPTASTDRYRDPEIYGSADPFTDGAGPWSLSVDYSMQRARPDETGLESKSLGGNLSLRPTPHWSIRWSTTYNITDSEFGRNVVTLDRDLHRWLASFQFARAPNGNTIFEVSLSLKDAPDVRTEYQQRTN